MEGGLLAFIVIMSLLAVAFAISIIVLFVIKRNKNTGTAGPQGRVGSVGPQGLGIRGPQGIIGPQATIQNIESRLNLFATFDQNVNCNFVNDPPTSFIGKLLYSRVFATITVASSGIPVTPTGSNNEFGFRVPLDISAGEFNSIGGFSGVCDGRDNAHTSAIGTGAWNANLISVTPVNVDSDGDALDIRFKSDVQPTFTGPAAVMQASFVIVYTTISTLPSSS